MPISAQAHDITKPLLTIMFNLLDDTLRKLLDAAPPSAAGVHFGTADISFETPEKGFAPRQGDLAINLFLYEVKENRELRQAIPDRSAMNGRAIRRRAPLRVDCSYMVTAWSNISNQDNVANAHRLLGQAFNWLSRFPTIPKDYLPQAMTGQLFDPPTMVAQMDGAKSAGEFWHALGIPPRPYFNLIVTICMDLDQSVSDSIVTTVTSRYTPSGSVSTEERTIIGGAVRDGGGNPVADAWVRVDETGETQVTNELGQFVCTSLQPGKQYVLRARGVGLGEVSRPVADVPSPSGEYDIVFP